METGIHFIVLICFTLPQTSSQNVTEEIPPTLEARPGTTPLMDDYEKQISMGNRPDCKVDPTDDDDALAGCNRRLPGSTEVIEYQLQLLLYTRTPLSVLVETLQDQFWKQVGESLKPFVRSLAESVNATLYLFSVGEFIEKPNWWQKWNYSDTPIYFLTKIQVDSNTNSSRGDESIESRLEILIYNLSLDIADKNRIFQSIIFNGTFQTEIKLKLYSDSESGKCCSSTRNKNMERNVITLEKMVSSEMSCHWFRLIEGHGYELVDKGIRLVFEWIDGRSITLEQVFTFHGHDAINICTEVYRYYFSIYRTDFYHKLLTVINAFTILSLICLFLTFITYCMFPSLLTTPAKNNMCLTFCMFMTYLLALLRNVLFHIISNTFCQILLTLRHYFHLSTILWMNVCCYHVFKGFVLSRNISHHQRKTTRTLLVYCLYANGLSALIVASVLTTNLIITEGHATGFGERHCYLNMLVQLPFIVLLCLVVLSNLIFIATTIYTISKTKQVRRNTGGDRKNLWVYMKLSSITGLFAIAIVIAQRLQSIKLVHIISALDSSQGVLLFFSYCVNRRVWELWKGKLLRKNTSASKRGQGGTSTTGSTTRPQ